MIYFARIQATGAIKIGHSFNVAKRMEELRAYYSGHVELIRTAPGGAPEEKKFHLQFASLRIDSTEQFRPGDELMDYLEMPRVEGFLSVAKTRHQQILHCRMEPEYLSLIDQIGEYYGIDDRSTTIRFLAKAECRRIDMENAESGNFPEKSPEDC